MPDATLALYLDGPMQSWGHQSRFNRRTTLSYPTRSGVTGMLCAAMGIDRADKVTLEALARLRMEIMTLATPIRPAKAAAGLTGAQKTGQFRHLSRWTDYHTVGGGYDPKTERQHMPRKASGAAPDTVVTDREYLADARFGVLIWGDPALLTEYERALRDPVWGIWLGRKCCIPASLVCQGVFSSCEEAEQHLLALSGAKIVRRISEAPRFDDGNDTLMDIPLCFEFRPDRFRPRRVCDKPATEQPDARI